MRQPLMPRVSWDGSAPLCRHTLPLLLALSHAAIFTTRAPGQARLTHNFFGSSIAEAPSTYAGAAIGTLNAMAGQHLTLTKEAAVLVVKLLGADVVMSLRS
jgi:hypothetical protein